MPVYHKFPQCHHIMVNGALCGSPAMKAKRFCYYHYYTPKPHHTLAIPLLDEGRALQVTVAGVLEGIQNKSLDMKQAYLMLY